MSTIKVNAIQHTGGSNVAMSLSSNGSVVFPNNTIFTSKVGIANTNPQYALDVDGYVRVQSNQRLLFGTTSGGWLDDNFGNGDLLNITEKSSGLRFLKSDLSVEHMRIDTNGNVTKPYHPAFHVSYPNSTTLRQSELIFTGTSGAGRFNTGGYYSTTTGRFTAPVAGRYMFMFTLRADGTNNYFHPKFVVNGSAYENGQMIWGGALDYKSCCSSVIYLLAAGDWVSVRTNESANDTGSLAAQAQCTFSGYLIG